MVGCTTSRPAQSTHWTALHIDSCHSRNIRTLRPPLPASEAEHPRAERPHHLEGTIMNQSQHSQTAREALTDVIIDAKMRKNLTFETINEGTGLGLAFVTAALLGQHPLPEHGQQLSPTSWSWGKTQLACSKLFLSAGASRAVCRPIRQSIASTRWCRSTAPRSRPWSMKSLATESSARSTLSSTFRKYRTPTAVNARSSRLTANISRLIRSKTTGTRKRLTASRAVMG